MPQAEADHFPAKILLVDDSPISLALIADTLEEWGHEVVMADSGREALRLFERQRFDLVITDMMMPDMDGTAVLLELRDRVPDVIVIMLSSYSQLDTVLRAMRLGAFDYVIKDERLDPLQGAIQRALMHLELLHENHHLMLELHQMNEKLETKVQQRTRQLERANRRLTIERGELERALRALNQTQAQLIQAEKMASIGVLTAGVAHEINNPLAFLLPNFECLERQSRALIDGDFADRQESVSEVMELLGDCREGLYRIRDIVMELSFFSRRSDSHEGRVALEPLVGSVYKLLSNQMCHVNLQAELDESLVVYADPGQLRQVMLNLLINAGHAIPEDRRGEVTLTATAKDDRVEVRITDNGAGIAEEDLPRIFDPFFTTKPVGKGTGMGLAITQQLVERMRGTIRVESRLGEGTSMILDLPLWSGDDESAPPEAGVSRRRTTIHSEHPALGRSQVLVIDDEQALLNSLRRLLSRDYEVVGFRRASQALEWLSVEGQPDVVICDLMMPEMSGIELFRLVGERDPELAQRFVFITGGTVTREAKDFVATCAVPVVAKPFELEEILGSIKAVLRRRPRPSRHSGVAALTG